MSRHSADAFRQLLVIHPGTSRLESGELVKLHCRSGHYETTTGVLIVRIGCQLPLKSRLSIFVFQNGRILKRESIGVEIETGPEGGSCRQQCQESAVQEASNLATRSGHLTNSTYDPALLASAKLPRLRNFSYRCFNRSSMEFSRSRARFSRSAAPRFFAAV